MPEFDIAATLTGIVSAVPDGDSLNFGDVEVRLQGIAAPEKHEQIGKVSGRNLRTTAEGKEATCYLDGTRTSDRSKYRPVAVCFVDGLDVGRQQVRSGHALDCPRFSKGRYAEDERWASSLGKTLSKKYKLPSYCRK